MPCIRRNRGRRLRHTTMMYCLPPGIHHVEIIGDPDCWGRHEDCADFFSSRFFIRAQHRATRIRVRLSHLTVAGNHQRVRDQRVHNVMADWPVRGLSRPFSAGLLRMASGVSPWGICHTISPLSRLIAEMVE